MPHRIFPEEVLFNFFLRYNMFDVIPTGVIRAERNVTGYFARGGPTF